MFWKNLCAGNVCWGTSVSLACLATTVVQQTGPGTGLASLDYTTVDVTLGPQLLPVATYVPTPGNGYAPSSNESVAAAPPPTAVRRPGPCRAGVAVDGEAMRAAVSQLVCACCIAENTRTAPCAI
jgi:hypothetical protein